MRDMNILISGCSGGGKSSVLDALGQLGHATVPEPGRRVVAEELRTNGTALPWVDMCAFAEKAFRVAKADLVAAQASAGFVFFDRGLVDAAVACAFAGGTSYRKALDGARQYAKRVYLAPPWPDIYVTDADRRHGLDDAMAEYQRLTQAFSELGYVTCLLPKVPVRDRAAFILDDLAQS